MAKLRLCVFGDIPYGRGKHINKIPRNRGQSLENVCLCMLFFGGFFQRRRDDNKNHFFRGVGNGGRETNCPKTLFFLGSAMTIR